ncbi:MAG: HIT domain-containing protein [Chloroflexi bacterium]|nr:HIT domain-containing protein [Chloroflexota bacterium]
MKRIWAPWRIDYIRSAKPTDCIFCTKPEEGCENDGDNLILYRGEHCYIMMNRYPYNNGHLMVVPYRHVDTPQDLATEELAEMMVQVNLCLKVLAESMFPDGFNIGMNLGAAAGAGIKDHIHMHVVPRWVGDTNFMPVLGDTRVIVEGIQVCYERLKPLFDREAGRVPEADGADAEGREPPPASA